VHSRQSGDASPSISNALEFAEEAGLDFIMLSEHNTNSGLTLYGSVQPDFPKLLIVPGVERTTYAGHANAIGAIDWVDHKVGVRGATVEGAIEAYQAQGGIWDAVAYWEQMCAEGSHATAVGGSDDHQAGDGSGVLYSPIGMPTTMVFAENLSVDAPVEGEDRYRHQIVAVVDPVTFGSYVWLRAAEPPELGQSSSGCGCSCRLATASGRDTVVLLVVIALGALYLRRRRRRGR